MSKYIKKTATARTESLATARTEPLDPSKLQKLSADADIHERNQQEKAAAAEAHRKDGTPIPADAGTRHPDRNVSGVELHVLLDPYVPLPVLERILSCR